MTQQFHCWAYTPRKPELKDTCTPMFIAALFIKARTWKQPRYPSADEWIRKLWYIYTMENYSAIKKNTFKSVLMRWMKLESEKVGLKLNIQKTKIMASGPITSWELDGETVETGDRKSTRLNSSHRCTSRMPSSA